MLERFARHNQSLRAYRGRPYFKPKSVHISDDGQNGYSLFSRQRDIMNQVSLHHIDNKPSPLQSLIRRCFKMLSPTIKHSSFDGSSSTLTFSRRSPSPRGAQVSSS